MTWFLVLSLSWTCPGGWFSGLVPPAARPLICKPKIERTSYDRLQAARDRVRAIGPDSAAILTQVHGLRLQDQPVTWETVVKFN